MKLTWLSILFVITLGSAHSWAAKCQLAVTPESLNPWSVLILKQLGYTPVPVPGLAFDSYRLSTSMPDKTPYALEFLPENKGLRIYFPVKTAGGARMIYASKTNLRDLQSCDRLQVLGREFTELRAEVAASLAYFKGHGTYGSAFIRAENTFEVLNSRPSAAPQGIKNYEALLARLAKLVPAGAPRPEDFFKLHEKIRAELFQYGMVNYCKSQSFLTTFLGDRCANCSAQTKIFLAVYRDLKIVPPAGWSFGGELFSDHIRPVIVNYKEKRVLDLVYNKVTEGTLANPILSADGLLRRTLASAQLRQAALFFPEDKIDLSNAASYDYRPDQTFTKRVTQFLGLASSEAVEALPTMDKDPERRIREASLYDVPTTTNFGEGEVPERADLSAALAQRAEDALAGRSTSNRSEGKSDGDELGATGEYEEVKLRAIPNSAWLNVKSVATLSLSDMTEYALILSSETVSPEQNRAYNQRNVRGFTAAFKHLHPSIQIPLRIVYKMPGRRDKSAAFHASLQVCEGYPCATIDVFGADEARRLQEAPLSERYDYLLAGLRREAKTYVAESSARLTAFLTAKDPVNYWRENSSEITRAAANFDRIVDGLNLLDPTADFGAFVNAAAPHARKSAGAPYAFAVSRFAFVVHSEKSHRQMIENLNALSDTEIEGFVDFFTRLQKYPQSDFFRWFKDISASGIPQPIIDFYEKRKLDFEYPLGTLMHALLRDPDYLYSTELSARERVMYGSYFQDSGAEPPKPRAGDVELPQVKWSKACPPEGGRVDMGSFVMECPKPKTDSGRKSRILVNLNPRILAGITRPPAPGS